MLTLSACSFLLHPYPTSLTKHLCTTTCTPNLAQHIHLITTHVYTYREIQKLLDASLGIVHDPAQYPSHYFPHESYLLLVEVDKDVSTWQGKNVPMDVAFETTIAVSKMEVCVCVCVCVYVCVCVCTCALSVQLSVCNYLVSIIILCLLLCWGTCV